MDLSQVIELYFAAQDRVYERFSSDLSELNGGHDKHNNMDSISIQSDGGAGVQEAQWVSQCGAVDLAPLLSLAGSNRAGRLNIGRRLDQIYKEPRKHHHRNGHYSQYTRTEHQRRTMERSFTM